MFAKENRFVKLFILFAFTSLFYYFLTWRFFCRKGKKILKNTSNYQLTKVPFVVIKKPLTCSEQDDYPSLLFVGGKVPFVPPLPNLLSRECAVHLVVSVQMNNCLPEQLVLKQLIIRWPLEPVNNFSLHVHNAYFNLQYPKIYEF